MNTRYQRSQTIATMTSLIFASSITLLAACSGTSQPSSSAIPAGPAVHSQTRSAAADADAVENLNPPLPVQGLAVSDNNSSQIEMLGLPLGATWLYNLTAGTPCPGGDWYERNAPYRLYVTNFGCRGTPGVTEYRPNNLIKFTYSTGLIDPLNVSTDNAHNVYVADWLGDQVVEYAQSSNVILHQCAESGAVGGVAAGPAGSVFVADGGTIIEYSAGLAGCAGTTLGATFTGAIAALLVDNTTPHPNLVACTHGAVYKIPYPYTTPTMLPATASYGCINMSLNRTENRLFITEPFNPSPDIQVVAYPAGTYIATIVPSASNQILQPTGIAAYTN